MRLRPLLIDEIAKQSIQNVIEYAKQHPYHYPSKEPSPGDNPQYVCHLNTYRCVFTFTHANGQVLRHLSISIPGTAYPNPFVVWTIAELFGFTGWNGRSRVQPQEWAVSVNSKEHCIVVIQEY
jgi:hypothetical protein